jgi:uncharacterized membrane protein YqaE (UPF0057 family)
MWLEIYLLIGVGFAILGLWAKKQLDEPIDRDAIISAILTVFTWLPFLIYYAYVFYRDWRRYRNEAEYIEQFIMNAIEEINAEVREIQGEKDESSGEAEGEGS